MTKPSRSTLYGREACSGSSLRLESACIEANEATVIGWMADSVPPAITTSAQAEPQVLERVDDRLGARRARGGHGARVGACAEVHRDGGGSGVGHEHRDRHRHDAPRSLLAQGVPRIEQRPDTADAGGEVDAEALGFDVGGSGVRPRLASGHEGELRRGVEALGLGALQHGVGAHERFRGERHRQVVLARPIRTRGCVRRRFRPAGPSSSRGRCRRSATRHRFR